MALPALGRTHSGTRATGNIHMHMHIHIHVHIDIDPFSCHLLVSPATVVPTPLHCPGSQGCLRLSIA